MFCYLIPSMLSLMDQHCLFSLLGYTTLVLSLPDVFMFLLLFFSLYNPPPSVILETVTRGMSLLFPDSSLFCVCSELG